MTWLSVSADFHHACERRSARNHFRRVGKMARRVPVLRWLEIAGLAALVSAALLIGARIIINN